MIATGSHSFEVSSLHVKNNRGFYIGGGYAKLPDPVYQYPFLTFAETTMAVNMSGMAMRFLDLCPMLAHWENAREKLENARRLFYEAVPLLKDISLASRNLASAARQVVNDLYPCCGLRAADPDTEINRIWRNIHTAGQHSLLSSCSDI